jgi:spore coat polysaccharide biosynthesis protein SpsF
MTAQAKPRVIAVVQARMGASRLPGKMLLSLNGAPIIEWIYRRMSRSRRLDRLVFAIPDGANDDALQETLAQLGAETFRGSESDVLGRFHAAAATCAPTHVVRICGDNPFVDSVEVDKLIDFSLVGEYDYAYNHIPRGNTYPDGLGAEIATMDVLDRINAAASESSEREHVFNHLWNHASTFRIGTFNPADPSLAHPDLRLDLDTPADYLGMVRRRPRITMSGREIVELFRNTS